MRSWSLLAVLGVALGWGLTACSATNTPDDPNQPSGGNGGAGGSGGQAGGGNDFCVPDNCPGSDTECQMRICTEDDQCAIDYAPAGTLLVEQVEGDCRDLVCDGSGNWSDQPNVNDLPIDDNDCTNDVCVDGVPANEPLAPFTPCGTEGGFCDGNNACVQCVDMMDCFSDGSDGQFLANGAVDLPGGVYNFTSFILNPNAVVTVTGNMPLIVKTQQQALINGALIANGDQGGSGVTFNSGGIGGLGHAGGGNGGDGFFVASGGPFNGLPGIGPGGGGGGTDWGPGAGAGYASLGGPVMFGSAQPGPAYGDPTLLMLLSGSGGGGGSGGNNCGGGGGGGGGGTIVITAFGELSIGMGGYIGVHGGNGGSDGGGACGAGAGGSGGTIWLRAIDVTHHGMLDADGGLGGTGWQGHLGGNGSPGRIRIDVVNEIGSGVVTPASAHNGGAWYQ